MQKSLMLFAIVLSLLYTTVSAKDESGYERLHRESDIKRQAMVAENLPLLIPSDQLNANPLRTAQDVDYFVQVRVIAFGSNPDGQVVLNAAWMIHDAADEPVKIAQTRFSAPRRGDDVVALVEVMSLAIEQLSRDIAGAITAASAQSIE